MVLRKMTAICALCALSVFAGGCSNGAEQQSTAEQSSLSQESLSAENILETAKQSNNNAQSYNATMDVYFEFENNGSEMNAEVVTNILSFTEPVFKHITMDVKQNGSNASKSDFYVDVDDSGSMYLYALYESDWYKMKVDATALFGVLGQYDIKAVLDILLTNSTNPVVSEETEKINGVDVYKVDCVIPPEKVPETIINTGVFVVNGMLYLTEEHLSGAGEMPVTYYISAETGDVVDFSFDAGPAYQTISDNMFNAVKDLEGYENAQKLVINSFNVDVNVDDINSAERIDVPDEVLAAQEMEDISVEETE